MADERRYDDEESEDDFNPAPADLSDEEGDATSRVKRDKSEDSDSNLDDRHVRESSDAVKAAPPEDDEDIRADQEEEENAEEDHEGDEDEDEDEEAEDDEDDEDDIQGHQRKRRKRARGNQFFDIEAEVEDEDEAEDDEKDGEEIGDFIDNEHPDDIVERGRLDDDRRHRELDRRREVENTMDAEKQAEAYRQKYARRRPMKGLGDDSAVPRRLLLPGVDDPKIWAVRCREGKEREVVFSIMKKIGERMGTKEEIQITSAFERAGTQSVMKGYVYVEAFKLPDIMTGLEGILNVYPRTKCMMIDNKEMPDLLRVVKTASLEPGAWVRLRRPAKHAGDLGQVLDITENGLEARVKFIPRLDYGVKEDARDPKTADGKRKRYPGMPGPRPPQRLFSEVEARKRNPRNLGGNPQTGQWSFNGDDFEHGFQVRDIKIIQLQVTNVNPTLEEVTKFASGAEDGTENLDLKALAASLKNSNANVAYLPGDVIEVYDGELKGVVGTTTNIRGDVVKLDVIEGTLQGQTIEVSTKYIRKRFHAGDHVKVTGGRFRDEVGMIVKIEEDRVTLLTDQSNTEITVFSKDLREASDIGGQGSLGQYSLLDLIELDPRTVGCIIKVDRETLGVLDQHGDTRQIMPSQVANRLPKRQNYVAADRNGSEIRLDDVVREYGGEQRQGKILHIHRAYVFLHSNTTNENAGVFVTLCANVNTIAAKGGRINAASGPDLDSMNPALKRNANGGNQMAAPQKLIGRDRAVGQTVTIRKGGYKGLLGIVKDTTDTHARVELHTKGKIVTVPKPDLIFKDKISGRVIDINSRGGMGGRGGGVSGRGSYGGAPSWDSGSRTPQVASGGGERTPAWGRATAHTPAWSRNDFGGSRTPAHDGSRTVNPYDGSRTAYGGGSRTPAWSSGNKTPAYDGFGHGSKTPAYGGGTDSWGAGSKTPAYGSAPTPGASNDSWGFSSSGTGAAAYDAPTPGAGLSAPTPGALNAPTPGAYAAPTPAPFNAPTPGGGWAGGGWGGDSAPTPAAGAPTPGAYYSAPTPAAFGGAAETPAPRYVDDDDE